MTSCSLVTGCAGFIGSHVAAALLALGHEVVGLDDLSGGFPENVPNGVRFVQGSVCDPDRVGAVFREQRIDYVFHLAAYAAEGLSHFVRRFNYDNNVIGSVSLINGAVNAGTVRCFVFTSSIAVYGDVRPPVTEDTPPSPADPYGIAKLAVELDLMAARRVLGLRYIVFRPHNVYGERQSLADPYRNVVAIFMNQLLRGEPMTVVGDGQQSRAFTHVSDVAPVIAQSVLRPECYDKIFNLGSDKAYSVIDLAHLTAKALEVAPDIRYLEPRREVVHMFARHDRMRQHFGDLQPHVPLPEGLARMARWARAQQRHLSGRTLPIEVRKNLPSSWT